MIARRPYTRASSRSPCRAATTPSVIGLQRLTSASVRCRAQPGRLARSGTWARRGPCSCDSCSCASPGFIIAAAMEGNRTLRRVRALNASPWWRVSAPVSPAHHRGPGAALERARHPEATSDLPGRSDGGRPDEVSDDHAAQAVVNPVAVWVLTMGNTASRAARWITRPAAGSTSARLYSKLARSEGFRAVNLVRRHTR